MTHAELVDRAVRWLKGAKRCRVVWTQATILTSEQPDAIGWVTGGWSILVECKASRADFFRDQNKWHRRGVGMGNRRWYLTPAGLVKPEEVPEGWGLLECGPRGVRIVKEAPRRDEWSKLNEIKLLVRHGTPPELLKRPAMKPVATVS